MEKFESLRRKQHLREVLLYQFFLKKSATEAHRLLQETYGDYALSKTQCYKWYQRFQGGNFDVCDRERPGQPKKFKDQDLKELLDKDSSQTQGDLASALNVTRQAISRRLKQNNYHLGRVVDEQ